MFKNQIKFIVILFCCSFNVAAFEYGNPTANEQAHLEMINRARLSPLNEASRLGIDLFEGVAAGEISGLPVQPLSFNVLLTETARSHSRDMLIRNFFAHNNPDGQTPFDRITAGGYIFRSAGENIAIIGETNPLDLVTTSLKLHDNLFIDKDFPGRGHRINILVPGFREIGVGLADGDWTQNGTVFNAEVVTTNFGVREHDMPIFLGVVYDDIDGDSFYDAGEGLSDIAVDILQTDDNTVTAAEGGYGMELINGNYLVTYHHANLGDIAKTLLINEQNKKVDVLLSEFTAPESASQCSLLADNQLLVPCVTVGNNAFVVDLSLTDANPVTFALNNVQEKKLTVTGQCAAYSAATVSVHFPCINVGKSSYWVDFAITGFNPINLTVSKFGKNK